jgi:hypothetical protein
MEDSRFDTETGAGDIPEEVASAAPAAGRRGALRSLGAAAVALLGVQSLTGGAAAKKKAKQEARRGRRGKTGFTGRQGPAGPPGVIGAINLVEDIQTIQPGQDEECFASCPPGQRVIAGGAFIDNRANNPLTSCFLYGSQKATVVAETWFGAGICPQNESANLRCTAFCVAA